MLNFTTAVLVFFCVLLPLIVSFEDNDDEELDLEESASEEDVLAEMDVVLDSENTTRAVDRSDEEWVREAVLDVAYFLRAHKFNDFDRRYFREAVEDSYQFREFPRPPLRYLHWEVSKHCDRGFYDCLAYLHATALKAELTRAVDTNTVMNERRWEFPRNAKSIEQLDKECLRLKAIDWRDADPFKGPLERFQWRVSASYYMCSFSMMDLSPLIMFGERCDNFAGCLEGKMPFNGDPRADDSTPYQCARYSFCPDVCCPLRKVGALDECLDHEKSPCFWQKERSKRACSFDRMENRDLTAMALNQWNVTCMCAPGYEWASMFGACVDVDECSAGSHHCVKVTQTCLNLQGSYACSCAWGFVNQSGTCVPNAAMVAAMASLHKHYHPSPAATPQPFSFTHFLFKWTFGVFFRKEANNGAAGKAVEETDNIDESISFNPDE